MGAAGGQGLPGPAASVPPLGLPRCPRSAPVLPWFSPNSIFHFFPLLSCAGEGGQQRAWVLPGEMVARGTVTPRPPRRPAAPWLPGTGHGDIAFLKTPFRAHLYASSIDPTAEVHPQHGCPPMQPFGVGGTVGTHLAGSPTPKLFQKARPWGRTGSQPPLASQPHRAGARGAAGLRISF